MNRTGPTRIESASLICGIAVPLVYFGIQLAAAPFYPGYSFFSQDASSLGSNKSSFPDLFNFGAIVVGLLLLCSSIGLIRVLLRSGARRWVSWTIFVALISGAISCWNAGVFPLPDQRHTSGLFATMGMGVFLLPILLPLLFPPETNWRNLRRYFWCNLAVLLLLIPIVSGLIQRLMVTSGNEMEWYQDFLNNGNGVLQRIAAAVVFVPVGVLSWNLLSLKRVENV